MTTSEYKFNEVLFKTLLAQRHDDPSISENILTYDSTESLIITGSTSNHGPDTFVYLNPYAAPRTIIGEIGGETIVRGNLGIGVSKTEIIDKSLTIVKNGVIGTNGDDGNLTITGSSSFTDSSRIQIYGNTTSSSSAGALGIYSGTQGAVKIFTGLPTENRLTVTSSGNVLFMPDGVSIVLNVTNASIGSNVALTINSTIGSTGVGTGGSCTIKGGCSIAEKLYVGESIYSVSDIRLKSNVTEYSYPDTFLDRIMKLDCIRYTTRGDDGGGDDDIDDNTGNQQIGFIAQQVIQQFPELVQGDGENVMYSVDYQKMTVILTKCIQELFSKVS